MTANFTSTPSQASQEAKADTGGDQPLLEVEGLKKHFDQSQGFLDRFFDESKQVRAVDGVDLTVRKGETLAIVGESGCGKSTLGQTILNILEPTAGTVRYDGTDLSALSERQLRPYRQDLQMIFQDPLASLNPRQTVGEIVKAPMEVHDIGSNDEERTKLARDILEQVGLKPGHIDRHPRQFSGGQQQRIGIARALTLEPELLVADEPVSALDVSVQAQILNLLNGLQEEFGLAMLFITHDLSVVRHVADRVAVMYLGEIVETAPTDQLFASPQHPYTKSLLSAVPRINPEARVDRVILQGSVPSPINPPEGCRFHTRCPAVIPPSDWEGDQEAFAQTFAFRNKVLSDKLEPETVAERIRAEGTSADLDRIASRLISQSIRGELDALPAAVVSTIQKAAEALVRGDEEEAKRLVRDAFPTPCEQEVPRVVDVAPDQRATCHRVDDEMEAEPLDW